MFDFSPSDQLVFSKFKRDPRIAEAKRLVLEALKDHQRLLTHVQPSKNDLKLGYEETLSAFNELRGGKLYYPYLGSGFGNGALVELLDGSVKYDMISGIGPHYWGHSHSDIINVAMDAALNDTVMQGHLQQNIDAFHLSRSLTQASGLDHCFLSSSGVMANENALKIAFQKKFPATRVLAFEKCFMGRSLTLSQITDKPQFREGLPLNLGVDYIPFYDHRFPKESTEKTMEVLTYHLKRYPHQHAVMCFELVQGEGGFNVGSTEFFHAIMKVLRDHDIAVFVDEVQTFGRTQRLFAFQHFHLEDYVDIVSVGKLSHVCATLFRSTFKPRPGLLSQTFTSSTAALQVGLYIIEQLIHGDYLGLTGKIQQVHDQFCSGFDELARKYPGSIEGPYGIGSMIGFTLFGGEFRRVTQFVQDLFNEGVISFVAGANPTRVRFLVPVGAIHSKDIREVLRILDSLIQKGGTYDRN